MRSGMELSQFMRIITTYSFSKQKTQRGLTVEKEFKPSLIVMTCILIKCYVENNNRFV